MFNDGNRFGGLNEEEDNLRFFARVWLTRRKIRHIRVIAGTLQVTDIDAEFRALCIGCPCNRSVLLVVHAPGMTPYIWDAKARGVLVW
jgi:hypothetical protein